ncbi:MAG: circularly permuted type 2 ATP-grasp protein, partial [Verrucomicrobia bacterium]|nr:circularly permuted type 2 ATP-grasp protein [Verrucomicrobiota bacterium]
MNAATASPATRHDLLEHYRSPETAYDELLAPDGTLRPHWSGFVRTLRTMGLEGVRQRVEAGRRLVEERGIQFLPPDAPAGMGSGWDLDPVPLLISPEDWRRLESGLIQRAILLNRILKDCYGQQELIRSQWLPPALVFGQSRFLRSCHGVDPAGGKFLHFYAADVARGPDGRWWVLSDRTQVPAGAGYALANRLVASRVFPAAFRSQHVHRLAGFFKERRLSLAGLSTQSGRDAHVVLLSPGASHETYFEHSYLARYMGYLLVEGEDLTVRDDRVFLKTLSGLEPVDVIIRRVKDNLCDPLELRNDSTQGVPGLLEAVRAGNVTIANALGSGLAEAPAFLSFLPGLCQHLLGEDLQIPSVGTWWCGQRPAADHVLANLDALSVQDAFKVRPNMMEYDGELTDDKASTLRERIRFQPTRYVARERLTLSHAPAWDGNRLVAKPVTLRVFLVATGDSYRLMPGGLAREAREPAVHAVTMRQNWTSKDVWVVSHKPVENISLLETTGQQVELRRVGNNLPSRLADDFYWLGRYIERAGATARLLRSALIRLTPEGVPAQDSLLAPLIAVLEAEGQLTRSRAQRKPELLENDLRSAIFDSKRPGSLRSIAAHLFRL